MRTYSDNAVQAADLETVKAQALLAVDTIDSKQNRAIAALRTLVVAAFVVNVALTLALKFL
jgi:hypothetical protein